MALRQLRAVPLPRSVLTALRNLPSVAEWLLQCVALASCGSSGAYRNNAIGMSYLSFYGGNTAQTTLMPRLEMVVNGPGPTLPIPVPTPPPNTPGVVLSSSDTSVEVSCDGGGSLYPALSLLACN